MIRHQLKSGSHARRAMLSFARTRVASSLVAPAALALMFLINMPLAQGSMVTLESGEVVSGDSQSVAVFDTTGSGSGLGLNSWTVDGVDHMADDGQQWFWYRVGDSGPEHRIDGSGPLQQRSADSFDFDGDSRDDFLIVTYQDSTQDNFSVQFRYLLTGSVADSGRSDIVEIISVVNQGNETLDFNLFQYVDFNLEASAGNDSLQITGNPKNTARQTDPMAEISETVVTPNPTRWQADDQAALLAQLDDMDADDLNNQDGPLISGDQAWAFQWSRVISPRGSLLISKDKNIRPGDHIVPEPSTLALAGLGLMGLLFGSARRRRRSI